MHPKAFFQNSCVPEPGFCFVLMPFRFHRVWHTIEKALTTYRYERADSSLKGGMIMEKILSGIARADVVIADLTKNNPNVFYELGIAHMAKASEKVIVIAQKQDDIPFDVSGYTCRFYKANPVGLKKLQRELSKLVKAVAQNTHYFYLSGGQYFRWDADHKPIPGVDGFSYSFRMSKVILEQDSVSYRLDIFRHSVGRAPHGVDSRADQLPLGKSRSIPKIPWRLKFESWDKKRALICVIPDYAESQSSLAATERQPNTGCSRPA